jgi:hypothetical protein
MSKSTPDDLVVTFRSLARRQREAIGDADPGSVGGALGELQRHVEAAADLLGVRPDATAVADAIDHRPADAWDSAQLDALRDEALAAGAVLRRIAAATGADDAED